jgi:hypothetical protein
MPPGTKSLEEGPKMPTHILPLAQRIAMDLATFDVRPAGTHEVTPAHALARALIGDGIVAPDDLARVHARTGAGLFVAYEGDALTGVLAFVLLNAAGHAAVLTEAFDALSPANAHIAGPEQPASAFYGWGVAATTRESAQRLIEGSRALGRGSVSHLPYYARPTTPKGERLMRERLGFMDVPGSTSGLVWAPPGVAAAAAVAA